MDTDWISIFTYAALFWLGFKIGLTRGRLEVLHEFLKRPNDIAYLVKKFTSKEPKLENKSQEEMTVERHDQTLYVYTKTGEFLAQGLTIQECLAKIETRFPDRKFHGQLSKEQADSLGINIK